MVTEVLNHPLHIDGRKGTGSYGHAGRRNDPFSNCLKAVYQTQNSGKPPLQYYAKFWFK
jgi:hypothetical protein